MSDGAPPPGAKPLPAPGSLGAWILAARPKTLVAGWAPVLVGSAIAYSVASLRPVRAVAALVVAIAIQVGTNLVNDAADFRRGADTPERLGPPRAVAEGLLTGGHVMTAAFSCFAIAGVVGLWLASVAGWGLLIPGGLAILAGVAYTAGPKPLAYLGLGEIFVWVFFGLFATMGSAFVQLGSWPAGDPLLSILAGVWGAALGLLAVAILELNNIRDVATDAKVGKATLAVRIGERSARFVYVGLLATAYVLVFMSASLSSIAPWLLLPVLSIPFAVIPARTVLGGARGRALIVPLVQTARLEAVFAALLTVALVINRAVVQ